MLALLWLIGIQIPAATAFTPNRQPQLASRGDHVGIAYGAGNAIYFAASADGGRTLGPPVLVSSSGQLSLGMHRGPRVAYTSRAIVIAAVVGEQGRGKDGDLVAWRSTDGGRSWSAPIRVNDVAGSAREGLHGMAEGGKDRLFAAWLDLRGPGTRVYGALSIDGGATWSPSRLVYESPSGTVCQCCHPSVAVDESGVIYVMFRNEIAGSRDLFLTRSEDGGNHFEQATKVGTGTWKLNGCPMDGGALAVDRAGRVATVWRRNQDILGTDGGGPERPLGAGRNPSLAFGRNGVYAVWTSGTSVVVRRPGAEQPEMVDAAGAFPAITALADGTVVVAWESKGAITVRSVR